ncbi:MAG: hypothetical protein NT082_05170 [Chloroflexi bacterium]|nr:hypothetical protein [Chloroflexota bacterium]
MDEILAIASKSAESAEVFRVTSSRTPVQFEANRLKQILTKETTATALRIVKNGRMGFAQASGRINAADLVNMALETSRACQNRRHDSPGRNHHRSCLQKYARHIM